MQDRYKILEETIKAECGRGPVYYLANSGNWGDGLIRHGTLKFFHDIGLNYKEIKRKKKYWILPFIRGGTVIYGGGGAWCKLWDHSHHVAMLRRRFNVIVLPSTYELSYSFFNTTFFCRDLFESKQNVPDAIFCHDMAFYIGKEFFRNTKGSGTGYFFRSDLESARRIEIPSSNSDISEKGNEFTAVGPFFDEVNQFAVVYTDRMHVAIAGCLLEKEVHLYSGAYFKSKAVYKSSMKDNFEKIHLHEDYDF